MSPPFFIIFEVFMKINIKRLPYDTVKGLPKPPHKRPLRPNLFFRCLIRTLSIPALCKARFSYRTEGMERAGAGPWLILMNHSCFLDLKIAYKIFFPKPFCVVSTTDGFVGIPWLMRWIGCIPTQKFVSDLTLVRDILHAIRTLNTSVLMYPEAGYSFDGTATPLPRKMGVLLKKLNVPVVTVITDGAYLRDPLYNGLRKRKVKVSATVKCLLTPEEIQEKSVEEIDRLLDETFTFDNFKWQQDNGIKITESFRAEGLQRILYQCPHCGMEGRTVGRGIHLTCNACGKVYELTESGKIKALEGETGIDHIPAWYQWQRENVRRQIEEGSYSLDAAVEIGVLKDYKSLYMIGDGRLVHNAEGFTLTSDDGALKYSQSPLASYTLNSDYYWYEIGDIISVGDRNELYYCFPKDPSVSVTKARLAAEELYKINKN